MKSLLELPPNSEWWSCAAVLASLMVLVGVGEGIRSRFGWSAEFTRKFVHIAVGLLIIFARDIFSVPLPALTLAIIFIAANLAAVRLGLLKGMHGTSRPTYGTVYYPLSFLILAAIFWYQQPLIISLSILVLALGDAGAAIVGETAANPALYKLSSDKKSVEGSITMFAVSFLVLAGGLAFWPGTVRFSTEYILAVAGVAAANATAWEALSSRGLDNLTVPLSVALVLAYYLIPAPQMDAQQFTLGAALAIFVAVASFRAGFLSPGGAVAAFLLAVVVFGMGGWKWTIPLVTFFLLSSVLSKLGSAEKKSLEAVPEKGSRRDHGQVFANGGIAGILVLVSYWFQELSIYPIFLASVAAVTADTWSTEVGTMSRGRTVLVTSFKPVGRGTNGGVSLAGSGAGILGGLVIAASAIPWIDPRTIPWIVLAGFAGSLVDSYAGATVQARYRCPVCGMETERSTHCNGEPAVHVSGFRFLTNDGVNWFCASAGAVTMTVLHFAMAFE